MYVPRGRQGAAVHAAPGPLSALLVAQGVLNENQASLWGGLVTALLGPGIAFVTARSVSTFRPAFYAMLAAGQAPPGRLRPGREGQVSVWIPLISAPRRRVRWWCRCSQHRHIQPVWLLNVALGYLCSTASGDP